MVENCFYNGKLFIHNTDNQRVFLDPDEIHMTCHMLEHGEWEPHIRLILHKVLVGGSKVIDVGANIGLHTIYASALVGVGGRVWAFEPNPKLYKLLTKNVEANGLEIQTTIYQLAVSNHVGEGIFNVFKEHESMSGFMNDIEMTEDKTELSVNVTDLDSIIHENVDLIKIDVEGFEYDVLQGAKNIINRSPNIVILFEWEPGFIIKRKGVDIVQKQLDFFSDEYKCYLAEFGKPLRKINREKEYKTLLGEDVHCDLIFTKSNKLEGIVGQMPVENISETQGYNEKIRELEKALRHATKAFHDAVIVQDNLKETIRQQEEELSKYKRKRTIKFWKS